MTAPQPVPACVICGAPEPFGLSVCPGCGGAAHGVGDTLIFVRPTESVTDRQRVAEALEPLLEGRTHPAERGLVAAGHRALIRVPAAAADSAIRHLAQRGIPALARTARRAWTTAPARFYLLVGAVAAVGLAAGMASEPLFTWTSPLVSGLLLLGAQVRLRQPVIGTTPRKPAFPVDIERTVVETFAQLPVGDARDLLARLVRTAESVHRALASGIAGARPEDVEELVVHACQAARDLSDLDVALRALEGHPRPRDTRRLRNGMVEQFWRAIGVLHRLRVETVDASPAREELAELLEALDEGSRASIEARDEIRTLLGVRGST